MTYPRLTRRRFIAISAAAGVAPSAGFAAPSAAWSGIALGAAARIELAGIGSAEAAPVFRGLQAEIDRLENIFSLYRPESDVSRLNRTGKLAAPPPEMLELLSLCGVLHRQTGGAFDPSIQPLWLAYANAGLRGQMPDPGQVRAAREKIGLERLRLDAAAISFDTPGMAITLNGIAQGYVTDRISNRLRKLGFGGIMVNMGEIRAAGRRASGAPWRARIALPDGRLLPDAVDLHNRALATSSPRGTLLDPARDIGHILDPRTGLPASAARLVSVSADTAALADGLSTACSVLSRSRMEAAVGMFADARLEAAII